MEAPIAYFITPNNLFDINSKPQKKLITFYQNNLEYKLNIEIEDISIILSLKDSTELSNYIIYQNTFKIKEISKLHSIFSSFYSIKDFSDYLFQINQEDLSLIKGEDKYVLVIEDDSLGKKEKITIDLFEKVLDKDGFLKYLLNELKKIKLENKIEKIKIKNSIKNIVNNSIKGMKLFEVELKGNETYKSNNHEHLLNCVYHDNKRGWICNICRYQYSVNEKAFRCKKCDYDMCINCVRFEKLYNTLSNIENGINNLNI